MSDFEPETGLIGTVSTGSRADALRSVRDLLARNLVVADTPREVAVVARELRELLRELDSLGGAEVDDVDDIAAQRAKRRAAAAS